MQLSQLGREPLARTRARPSLGSSVPAVAGRRHADLQTDSWLEEISEKKEEKEMGVQVTGQRISTDDDDDTLLQVNLSETWAETEDVFGQQRLEVRQTSNMVDKVIQIYLAQYL